MNNSQFKWLLRWYPRAWQARYGDELVALMEDTYAAGKIPLQGRLGIIRSGISEHLAELGIRPDGGDPNEQVRSGALLILGSWALFVIAGAGFAKFTEHWDAATPPADRWLPAGAYDLVQWSAGIAAAILLVGAMASLPSFARFLSDGGWRQIRRSFVRAAIVTATTASLTLGIVIWAHHIGPQQRNGGSWSYLGAGMVWVLLIVATILTCTTATVSTARRLELSPRVVRLEGALALLLTLAMVAIAAGTLVWWSAVATASPQFFSGSQMSGLFGTPASPIMIVVEFLIIGGLTMAASGAGRVARSIRSTSTR